jgi:hypothetical protein
VSLVVQQKGVQSIIGETPQANKLIVESDSAVDDVNDGSTKNPTPAATIKGGLGIDSGKVGGVYGVCWAGAGCAQALLDSSASHLSPQHTLISLLCATFLWSDPVAEGHAGHDLQGELRHARGPCKPTWQWQPHRHTAARAAGA